jgi:hypothetical protein
VSAAQAFWAEVQNRGGGGGDDADGGKSGGATGGRGGREGGGGGEGGSESKVSIGDDGYDITDERFETFANYARRYRNAQALRSRPVDRLSFISMAKQSSPYKGRWKSTAEAAAAEEAGLAESAAGEGQNMVSKVLRRRLHLGQYRSPFSHRWEYVPAQPPSGELGDPGGAPFYYCPGTGDTAWNVPAGVHPCSLYSGDDGRHFYHNSATGETAWTLPNSWVVTNL